MIEQEELSMPALEHLYAALQETQEATAAIEGIRVNVWKVVGWFSYCFEGLHREVASERLLLNAISVARVAALVSYGKTPTTLVLLFTSLNNLSSIFVERILAW